MKRFIPLAALALLAGCATPGPSALITIESADAAALAGLIAYEKLPNPSAAVIAQAKGYQVQVDAALAPLEAAAAAGGDVTNAAELEAASVALTALTTYETDHNIKPGA
jgi:hypothetical protein